MSGDKANRILEELRKGLANGEFGGPGDSFITVRDICARWGVALKTGFNVMTRLREEGCIEKSGRGHCIARSICAESAEGEGPLLVGFLATCLESPYFAKLAGYAETFAHSIGASLVIASSNYDFETERERLNMFCRHGVSGILACPWASTPEQEAFYSSLPVPCVMIGRRLETVACDSVLVNNRKASRDMARHFVEKCPGEYAYIGLRGKVHDSRFTGFRSGLLEAGASLPGRNVLRLDYSDQESCRREMCALLSRPRNERLSVFCYHDLFALRLNNICHALGLNVPGDVAIGGFDDLPAAAESWPPLTSVSYPVREMVQLAFEALYSRIRFRIPPKGISRYLDSKLVIRESTIQK